MGIVLAVAAHPDDETLGCGGTLLRHRAAGDQVHWLIATEFTTALGGTPERVASRDAEITAAAAHFGFASTRRLGFPSAELDTIPRGNIVRAVSDVIRDIQPGTLYLPFRGDAHSDHAALADACLSATKSFRQPCLRRIRTYETLSETEFQIGPGAPVFVPNCFVDISAHLEGKLAAMRLYVSEMGEFPFPRSDVAIRAQAALRGSTAGCHAAEAFMTLREIV